MINSIFKKKAEEIKLPCTGEIIPIEQVQDNVFSKKIIGDGIAVVPHEDTIYSPINGKVTQIFETKHAIIVSSKKNTNILIHVGMDTVNLQGEPFDVLVEEGQPIKEGQPLMHVNFKLIKDKGLSTVTPIVVVDGENKKIRHKIKSTVLNRGETIYIVE